MSGYDHASYLGDTCEKRVGFTVAMGSRSLAVPEECKTIKMTLTASESRNGGAKVRLCCRTWEQAAPATVPGSSWTTVPRRDTAIVPDPRRRGGAQGVHLETLMQ